LSELIGESEVEEYTAEYIKDLTLSDDAELRAKGKIITNNLSLFNAMISGYLDRTGKTIEEFGSNGLETFVSSFIKNIGTI